MRASNWLAASAIFLSFDLVCGAVVSSAVAVVSGPMVILQNLQFGLQRARAPQAFEHPDNNGQRESGAADSTDQSLHRRSLRQDHVTSILPFHRCRNLSNDLARC